MSTPQDKVDDELSAEVDARVRAWKRERAELEKASTRMAELDQLIGEAEARAKPWKDRIKDRETKEAAAAVAEAANKKVK